jgi:hypothetical protein
MSASIGQANEALNSKFMTMCSVLAHEKMGGWETRNKDKLQFSWERVGQ